MSTDVVCGLHDRTGFASRLFSGHVVVFFFLCNSLIFSLFLKTEEDDSSCYANKRIWGHSPLQSCCRENEGDTSRRSGR